MAVYDAYGTKLESYTYDEAYHQTSVTNANGTVVKNEYDLLGNRIRTLNEADGSVTEFAYTGGMLMSAAADAEGGTTGATYDEMGNLKSFTDPNGGVTSYEYDKNQNVTSQRAGEEFHLTYQYDKAGHVVEMTNSRGQKTVYAYDKAGRMIRQKDEAGEIRYDYDGNGNCLKVSEVKPAEGAGASDSEEDVGEGESREKTIRRTFDQLNRAKTYTDTEGNKICYQYDEFGNLEQLTYPDGKTVTYTYDKNGNRLSAGDWKGRKFTYQYDRNNRLVRTERPDGSREERTYDKMGQLLSIRDKAKDGTVIMDLSYIYDLSGNNHTDCRWDIRRGREKTV